jgi:hypothetical protein
MLSPVNSRSRLFWKSGAGGDFILSVAGHTVSGFRRGDRENGRVFGALVAVSFLV